MLARHAREARPQARQRSRAPRRSCKPRHVLLVALPTSLAGLVGLWQYTSIARRRPTTTALPAAAVPLPAVVPFVVLFESSSGSSWLMQELGALPEVCAIGFEPIDNISMASAADHTLRLRWLRTLWTPQRGSASEWLDWQAALQRADLIHRDRALDVMRQAFVALFLILLGGGGMARDQDVGMGFDLGLGYALFGQSGLPSNVPPRAACAGG